MLTERVSFIVVYTVECCRMLHTGKDLTAHDRITAAGHDTAPLLFGFGTAGLFPGDHIAAAFHTAGGDLLAVKFHIIRRGKIFRTFQSNLFEKPFTFAGVHPDFKADASVREALKKSPARFFCSGNRRDSLDTFAADTQSDGRKSETFFPSQCPGDGQLVFKYADLHLHTLYLLELVC